MMEKKCISIVGEKKTGKTKLIESIVPILKEKGYKVGVIKHTHHNFEIDYPGKDTYRFSQSGADSVAIFSSEKFAFIKKTSYEMELKDIIELFFKDMDIILIEGFKRNSFPKIWILKDEEQMNENFDFCIKSKNGAFNKGIFEILKWIEEIIKKGGKNE